MAKNESDFVLAIDDLTDTPETRTGDAIPEPSYFLAGAVDCEVRSPD